jgi:hypothetical protein
MSLTYGTLLTEGYGWAPATVGLVNVSHTILTTPHNMADNDISAASSLPA